MKVRTKPQARRRRHLRVRRKISGTAERPRVCVYVSNRHMYVQVIDDEARHTLAAASTMEKDLRKVANSCEAAKEIGKRAGERAKALGVNRVVFDRGGFAYGARVRALADAAREAGLEF